MFRFGYILICLSGQNLQLPNPEQPGWRFLDWAFFFRAASLAGTLLNWHRHVIAHGGHAASLPHCVGARASLGQRVFE